MNILKMCFKIVNFTSTVSCISSFLYQNWNKIGFFFIFLQFCPLAPPLLISFSFSELKSNRLRRLPDLRHCRQLRLLDVQHNEIGALGDQDLAGLGQLQAKINQDQSRSLKDPISYIKIHKDP